MPNTFGLVPNAQTLVINNNKTHVTPQSHAVLFPAQTNVQMFMSDYRSSLASARQELGQTCSAPNRGHSVPNTFGLVRNAHIHASNEQQQTSGHNSYMQSYRVHKQMLIRHCQVRIKKQAKHVRHRTTVVQCRPRLARFLTRTQQRRRHGNATPCTWRIAHDMQDTRQEQHKCQRSRYRLLYCT